MAILLPVNFSFNTSIHRKPQSSQYSTTGASFLFKLSPETFSKPHICFALSPSSGGDRSRFEQLEEVRWLREEQRWLREEQRWLREELRWNAEREALLREIQALQLQIQELKSRCSLQEASDCRTIPNVVNLSEEVKEVESVSKVNTIAAMPLIMEAADEKEEVDANEIVKGVVRKANEVKKRETLGKGSEGADVPLMQVCANGAAIVSRLGISEFEQKVVKSDTETDVTQHRVFLLGENRWEEPSRLKGNKQSAETKSSSGMTTKNCLSCHGVGHLLCMECDGTGEPNIESQFMEWVGEGAKCPYCEGLGIITCDVCEGKKVAHT